MYLIRIISTLFFLQLSLGSLAQIDWNNPLLEIGKNEGLPSTYIKDFVEDDYGFIWILTYSGLCRYDGSQLEVIRDTLLPLDRFSDLEYDAKRKLLWISSYEGLYTYHLFTGKVSRYEYYEIFEDNVIQDIALDLDGQLWFGTRAGLGKVDLATDSILVVPINVDHPKISAITFKECWNVLPDPVQKDRIWLSTEGGIVLYYPATGLFEYADELIGNYARAKINEIYVNPTSQYIYFGTLATNSRNPYNYLVFDAQKDQQVQAIFLNDHWDNRKICAFRDSLVLLSTSMGVTYYNEGSGQVVRNLVNEPGSSIYYRVNFVDSKGNIWAGTKENIKMYSTSVAPGECYYYQSDFPQWYHIINGLYYDEVDHSVYLPVFGGEGLYKFGLEKREWTLFPYYDKDRKPIKTDFTVVSRFPDGQLKILGNSGVYWVNGVGEVEEFDFPLTGQRLWMKGIVDSKGLLWGTNINGVVKVNLKANTVQVLTEEIHYCKAKKRTIFFEDSQSNIWIGGFCGGFDRYDRQSNTYQSFDLGGFTKSDNVTSFDEKDGKIWIQAENGDIMVVDVKQPKKGIIKVISLKDQIDQNKIKLVNAEDFTNEFYASGTFDLDGRFWFLSQAGIFCYDDKAAQLELFGESVGIVVNDPELNVFVANVLIRLPDGKMLFHNRKGVCLFDPKRIGNQTEVPVPYVRAISVNNEYIKFDSSSIFKSNYSFKPKENFIGFYFSAVDFSLPTNVKFLYKLEGVDEEWKDPRNKRYVSYTQLQGGEYTFLLKACNAGGIWSDEIVKINVHVAKFWYKERWAMVLFLGAMLLLILAIYSIRLRRAIEKEQVKIKYEKDLAELKMQALTAQMNPHFIFNSLNSIDFYIIKNETKKASGYLNRFSRLMRLILKNSRSNYVTLKDDLEALKLYLEIECVRFNHSFDFEIKVDENIDIDYLKIPPMLIQPYVENSIWHGQLHKKENGKITVCFVFDEKNESLHCTIIDNGIGRKKSMEMKLKNGLKEARKSFGMNITKDKIEIMKILHGIDAKVEIFDLYDDQENSIGTKVELSIPI